MLEINNLHVTFKAGIHAVRGVSFSINPKETVGIVGESGCGKTALIKALVQLHPRATTHLTGQVLYQESNLLNYSEKEMQGVRGKEMGMIFQDPMTSLNPTTKIGPQIMEGYLRHFPRASKKEAQGVALEMLAKVGIADAQERFHHYPHMFSGGMRQRVMIALALACRPKILLADEPTTALDVTIQAQILKLLKTIQAEMGNSILLITHDMRVIQSMCDRVLVMYAGKVVESGPTHSLFTAPQHPYTMRLLKGIPSLHQPKDVPLDTIEGTPPPLTQMAPGCSFCPRCIDAMRICAIQTPDLIETVPNHFTACFIPKSLQEPVFSGALAPHKYKKGLK